MWIRMAGTGRADPGEGSALASRLDRLFRLATGPDGKEPSYRQVSTGIHELTGVQIGVSTLHALRTGTVTDPRMSTIEAIARYFGVPVGYFFDQDVAQQVDSQLALLRAMRDQRVQALALRAEGLSTETLDMLRAVIDQARTAEGLDRSERRVFRRRPRS